MDYAIETCELTRYYGTRPVVHRLNLRVPTGCVYGFLGRNGAGKTTTVKMLLGLLRPDYGTARVLGHDAADLAPEVRARIAYIAENHPLYRWMSVGEMVDFTRAFYRRWNDHLVEQILDHFGLSRRTKLNRLSNGQRAQVSLTLAVAPDPELLILDDPTLGLDSVVRRDFLESMVAIVQRPGRTILFSSHILGDVERVCDRVGILMDGALRVDCPTDHFTETLRRVVLEFGAEPPPVPAWPRLLGGRQVGRALELLVVGYDDDLQQRAEALHPRRVDVVRLSLEDAFIDYTRGVRRPLPIFARETPDVEGDGS